MDKNIYSHELLAQLWKTVKSGKRKSQTHRGRPRSVWVVETTQNGPATVAECGRIGNEAPKVYNPRCEWCYRKNRFRYMSKGSHIVLMIRYKWGLKLRGVVINCVTCCIERVVIGFRDLFTPGTDVYQGRSDTRDGFRPGTGDSWRPGTDRDQGQVQIRD